MAYSGEGVNALVCAIDDLKNTTILAVETRVRAILKCLAYYKEFRDVLEVCNRGFDFQAEQARAFGKIGDSDVLRLPKEKKALVAFVAAMLVEFDAGTADIVLFVTRLYPSPSKQESLAVFCDKVMEPFKLAIVDFVCNGCEEDPVAVERTVQFAPNGLQQQTAHLLVAMMNAVREAAMDTDERAELTVMLEGLAAALDARDTLMIKAVWLGLRFRLASKKLCKKEVAALDDALRLYLVQK